MEVNRIETNKNKIIFILLLTLSEKWNNEILVVLIFIQLIIYILRYGVLKNVFDICKYLIYIFIISFVMSNIHMFYDAYSVNDILRDIYIFITPIIYILYGGYYYYLKLISKYELYQSIVTSGVIISLIHLFEILVNLRIFLLDINNRAIAGTGSIITILAIIILTFIDKNDVKLLSKSKLTKNIKLIILVFSFILYFSRTDIILLLCFVLCMILIQRNINIIKILKIITYGVILSIVIVSIIPSNIIDSFFDKTIKSFQEISSERTEVWDWYNINNNWRGYEIYKAKDTIKNGNVLDVILGNGNGKSIDLDTEILLGEDYYSRISILHNGYYYTILKAGIVGIILYILFAISILIKSIRNIFRYKNIFENKLLCGIVFGILFSTIVVSGLYNKGSIFSYCFIIGYLSIYNERIPKDNMRC